MKRKISCWGGPLRAGSDVCACVCVRVLKLKSVKSLAEINRPIKMLTEARCHLFDGAGLVEQKD